MTTRVHIVNLGPDRVEIKRINPQTSEILSTSVPLEIYPGDSVNEYVYDSLSLIVNEKPVLKKD